MSLLANNLLFDLLHPREEGVEDLGECLHLRGRTICITGSGVSTKNRRRDGDEEPGSIEEFAAIVKPGLSPKSPFSLPLWARHLVRRRRTPIVTARDRMRFVIQLALTNMAQGTGGPFGAAVFETKTGRLVSIGVNLVVSANCSHAHAEMVALANAQQTVGHFDLGAAGMPKHELVTSSEPCAMCYGAIVWSGIRKLVCGARGEDAEAIGFDEGPKPKNWVTALKKRGIAVILDLCRNEAVAVLQKYEKSGGVIYNARQGS